MARTDVQRTSAPSSNHHSPSQSDPDLSKVNALLVALASLLRSRPAPVHDVLPHLGPDLCASYFLPQRKLLDTLASLIAFHPHCSAAAVALEATPARVGLYIAAATANAAATTTDSGSGYSPPDPELCADVETWLGLVRDIARDGTASTKPLRKADEGKPPEEADAMNLPDTQFAVSVFRASYTKLRTRLRELPLGVLLCKIERSSTHMTLASLASFRSRHAYEERLERLYEHLEVLLRLTEPAKAAEIGDARHFMALHVAGEFSAKMLRDKGFCAFLNGIDREAVEMIEQASLLSRLVSNLTSIARASGMEGALAVPWSVEWIAPPAAALSFEATIDLPLLQEWLRGLDWEPSPFLDDPPDAARWPYSKVVAQIAREVPCDLVRTTAMSLGCKGESSVGGHHYTLASAKNRSRIATNHCEVALLRYFADPANTALTYPYIATSYMSCYACVMLTRAVAAVHGAGGKFMLRGCEASVELPWMGDGVAGFGEDVVKAMVEGMEADLRRLIVDSAERVVQRSEVGVMESIPEMLNGLFRWG